MFISRPRGACTRLHAAAVGAPGRRAGGEEEEEDEEDEDEDAEEREG